MMQRTEATQSQKIIVLVDAQLEAIVPRFLEKRLEDVGSIREALKQGDYETIRTLGHSMKGSGGGYGFDAVTDMGQSLEEAAKGKSAQEIVRTVDELSTYLASVEVVYTVDP